MPAIAGDLHDVLLRRIPAMITAKFRISRNRTIAHIVPAFTFLRHKLPSLA
jgi:hypothetical protein